MSIKKKWPEGTVFKMILWTLLSSPLYTHGSISRFIIYKDTSEQREKEKSKVAENGYEGSVKVYENSDPLTEFISRSFSALGSKHTSKERVIEAFRGLGPTFVKNYDKTKKIQQMAYEVSEELCAVPWDERRSNPDSVGFSAKLDKNETDAVRHFSASALMAIEFGHFNAKMLMTAREEGQKVHRDELMDLYNNDLGFRAGLSILETMSSRTLSQDEIKSRVKAAALQHLHGGKLSVILSGGDRKTPGCTLPKLYPNEKHTKVDLGAHFLLKNGIPKECQSGIFRQCKERKSMRGMTFCLNKSMNRKVLQLERLEKKRSSVRNKSSRVRGTRSKRTQTPERYRIEKIRLCQKKMLSLVHFFGEPRDIYSYPDGELPKEIQTPVSR